MPDNTEKKQVRTKFQKGKSGNPYGRPCGAKNKATMLAQVLLERDIEAICNRVIDDAKKGNLQAIKLVLERIIPPKKDSPITLELPQIQTSSDILLCANIITDAVSKGELSPSEGEAFSRILDIHSKAIELNDIDKRLKVIEEKTMPIK